MPLSMTGETMVPFAPRVVSLTLPRLAVCRLLFMALSIGATGRIGDSTVFADSPLGTALAEGPDADGYRSFIPPGGYIVGDGAYSLAEWLLKPFDARSAPMEAWTAPMVQWTFRMRKARRVTERAFGVFKKRFKLFASSTSELDLRVKIDLCWAAAILYNMRRREVLDGRADDDDALVSDAQLLGEMEANDKQERELAWLHGVSAASTGGPAAPRLSHRCADAESAGHRRRQRAMAELCGDTEPGVD